MVLSVASSAAARPKSYTVDPSHTFPSFEVNHANFSIQRGRFNNTRGTITLDTYAQSGTIEIKIDAGSIDTGLAKLEDNLRAEDFFDVEKHPEITFKSTELKFEDKKLVGAQGELTLLGVTKPVSLTVNGFYCGHHPLTLRSQCGADVRTTIKRSDFGMTYAIPMVGDEVTISIQIEALEDFPLPGPPQASGP
ncbi:MAG: YceI family protein [Burkholderiales bacterium]